MQITINITDDAVKGKISKCKGRMLQEWQPRLLADPEIESIPATEAGLLNTIVAHKDYKSRTAREAVRQAKEV
jgi:hypothetical protein